MSCRTRCGAEEFNPCVCVCVCVCARLPIPVAGNTWRVYVRSQERLHPLEIRLTSCLQIPFFVRCWWWRLISSVQWWSCESACLRGNEATTAPGFFVTCRKLHLQLHPLRIIRRTRADHQRACVGWDDSIDTIVCAHVHVHSHTRTYHAYATVWGTEQMRALCWTL